MLLKSSCTLLAAGALLVGEALAGSPFERFAEFSRKKGSQRQVPLNKVEKTESSANFRYLNSNTKSMFRPVWYGPSNSC